MITYKSRSTATGVVRLSVSTTCSICAFTIFQFSAFHLAALQDHNCKFQMLRGSDASTELFCAFWEGHISGPGEIPSYRPSLPFLLVDVFLLPEADDNILVVLLL